MNTQLTEQTTRTKRQDKAGTLIESIDLGLIGKPVGTFAGTLDRILRVRNGEIVPADTGDQGGGQN